MADGVEIAEKTKPEKDAKTGRFVTGNIGGGRKKGSRNKLGEAFLDDMYADWEKHGPKVIKEVRKGKPDVYLKVVASVLPKNLNVNLNPMDELSDEDLLDRIRELESAIRPYLTSHRDGAGTGEIEAGAATPRPN